MELNYTWKANYSDGSKFNQFVESHENLFGDIDTDNLYIFSLEGKDERYSVNLKTGSFSINNQKTMTFSHLGESDFRLIYFRRNSVSWPAMDRTTIHNIGLQTTIDGKNKKVILQVPEDGSELNWEFK